MKCSNSSYEHTTLHFLLAMLLILNWSLRPSEFLVTSCYSEWATSSLRILLSAPKPPSNSFTCCLSSKEVEITEQSDSRSLRTTDPKSAAVDSNMGETTTSSSESKPAGGERIPRDMTAGQLRSKRRQEWVREENLKGQRGLQILGKKQFPCPRTPWSCCLNSYSLSHYQQRGRGWEELNI